MNFVDIAGRLIRDPRITEPGITKTARYTLAVDREPGKKPGKANLINCVCFGKAADYVEKFLHKGVKVEVVGRLESGSYMKDGRRVYVTEVIVKKHMFYEVPEDVGRPIRDRGALLDIPEESFDIVNAEDGSEELPFA